MRRIFLVLAIAATANLAVAAPILVSAPDDTVFARNNRPAVFEPGDELGGADMVMPGSDAAEIAYLAQTGAATLVSVSTNSAAWRFDDAGLWLFGNAFVVNEADSFVVGTARAEVSLGRCAIRVVSDAASTKIFILYGYATVRPTGKAHAYRFPPGSMVEVKDRGWRQPITARRLNTAERAALKAGVAEVLN